MQPPGTYAYRLHFVGGHFQARPRDEVSCGFVYRLAMRSAGGLSGPRGLAVPLGTEYEYNDMNGSLHSSRMVARGANPQASARESMEPTGNSDPSANSFISPWCHQSRCEIEGFHQDDDIAQQNPAPHFHGAHYHSTFPTQPSTLPHATHPPTPTNRSQHQTRHDYSPNGTAQHGYSSLSFDAMSARQAAEPGYVPAHHPHLLLQAARILLN